MLSDLVRELAVAKVALKVKRSDENEKRLNLAYAALRKVGVDYQTARFVAEDYIREHRDEFVALMQEMKNAENDYRGKHTAVLAG